MLNDIHAIIQIDLLFFIQIESLLINEVKDDNEEGKWKVKKSKSNYQIHFIPFRGGCLSFFNFQSYYLAILLSIR